MERLEIQNLSKYFGRQAALCDVSFHVEEAQVYGLIGENGAGKTTLIRCLTGIYRPDTGEVLYNGDAVYDNPAVKQRIGYVADSNQYFKTYTVKKMVEFFAGMYTGFSPQRFGELNELFRLPVEKRVAQLSKGQQMRLALMLNIAIGPQYLILDEPTAGLDAIAKRQLFDMLIDEVERRGTSVVISSHSLGELERLCDRMSILQQGRLLYETDLDAIKAKVKKIQAVFDTPPTELGIQALTPVGVTGSIYYYITDDYSDGLIPALKARGAVMAEQTELSLEEIFVYLNRRR